MAAVPNRSQVAEMLSLLRSRGERVTTARRAVLEALVRYRDDHLGTEELALRIREDHPDIHLSTVYRTLEYLEDQGLVHHVHLAHRAVSHHVAQDHHQHAVCDHCGRAFDLDISMFDELSRRLADEHGFTVELGHITIGGRCADCSA